MRKHRAQLETVSELTAGNRMPVHKRRAAARHPVAPLYNEGRACEDSHR